jgi:hypothetical protein
MKYILGLLFFGLVTICFSCSYTAAGHKTNMFKNTDGWFPNDFDPDSVTLVIQSPPTKSFKKKIDTLLKNYPCKYILVKNISQYFDPNKYRYLFKLKFWQTWYTDAATHISTLSTYADYYITDQLKNIDYPPTGYYTSTGYSYAVIFEILKYIKGRYGAKLG